MTKRHTKKRWPRKSWQCFLSYDPRVYTNFTPCCFHMANVPSIRAQKQFSGQAQESTDRVDTYLDGPVQRCTGELIVIFGIYHNLHNVMCVSFKHLWTRPFFIPVPELNKHVIYTKRKSSQLQSAFHFCSKTVLVSFKATNAEFKHSII